MKEIWKKYKSLDLDIELSSLGRIKENNEIVNKTTKKYFKIIGKGINGKRKTYLLHRLIAQLFIPNPENKPQVNHINGIKTDNRVENLEWVTAKENILHAYQNGLKSGKKGSTSHFSKLTEKERKEIVNESEYLLPKHLSKIYGISISYVNYLIKNSK